MKIYSEKYFFNHLDKICKNDFIKNTVLEYYNFLVKSDIKVEKTYYNNIILNNLNEKPKVLQSDIVEYMKKQNKNSITIAELFRYNFCRCVDATFFKSNPFEDACVVGCFESGKRNIVVGVLDKKNDPDYVYLKNVFGNSFFHPAVENGIGKMIDYKQSLDNRLTIFHELTHVLEVKTFNHHNFLSIGDRDLLSIKGKKTKEIMYSSPFRFGDKHILEILGNLHLSGLVSFAEVFNEYRMGDLINQKVVNTNVRFYKNYFTRNSFSTSEKHNGRVCGYNRDIELVFFMNLIGDSSNLTKNTTRFNSLLNNLNKYKLTDKEKSNIKQVLLPLIKELYSNKKYKGAEEIVENATKKAFNINALTTRDYFQLIIGLANKSYQYGNKENCFALKSLADEFLLKVCYDKIKSELKFADIVGDKNKIKKLLIKYDNQIKNISNFCYLKEIDKRFIAFSEKLKENKSFSIKILPFKMQTFEDKSDMVVKELSKLFELECAYYNKYLNDDEEFLDELPFLGNELKNIETITNQIKKAKQICPNEKEKEKENETFKPIKTDDKCEELLN